MTEGARTVHAGIHSGRSLLYVATVPVTIRQFLVPYAKHFRALGWRVAAVANGATLDSGLRDAFDDLYELPLSRSIRDVPGLIRAEQEIFQVLAARPDIVHVHTPIASFITRLAIRRMPKAERPAVAYTAHGFHFYRGGRRATNLAFLTAERLAGRWTDRLIVINDEDEAAAIRHHIVPRARLSRMPGIGVDTEVYSRSSIDADEIARIRRELSIPPDVPYFAAVGEFSRGKRTADIIEALATMRHNEAALVLAGTGPERERLERIVMQRGVHDRVRFAGQVGDVRPLVADAIALVNASDREGLARAIMEALALEVPVIASQARGNEELVADSGFVFPIRDIDLLAAQMDWLIDHPVARDTMGPRGRSRMVERYDVRRLLRLHEEMYHDMCEEAARA